jgi:hypothetical protein
VQEEVQVITKPLVWSRYAVMCHGCNRRFRVGKDALATVRQSLIDQQGEEVSNDNTDGDVAAGIEFCLECSGGLVETGEFINDNPYARRWDPKGWALDTLAALVRELAAVQTFELHNNPAREAWFRSRMKRRAFVAEALRDRIDGRF